ncbi:hypothetical protein HDU97_009312 [Phlyctochytrium planicorne]|nr:hypothetical protein HDU97_009312 [Phlyctochytrium planicorne]
MKRSPPRPTGYSSILEDDDMKSAIASSEISVMDMLSKSERILNGKVVIDMASLPQKFASSISTKQKRKETSAATRGERSSQSHFVSKDTLPSRSILQDLPSSIGNLYPSAPQKTSPERPEKASAFNESRLGHSKHNLATSLNSTKPKLSKVEEFLKLHSAHRAIDPVMTFNQCSFFGRTKGDKKADESIASEIGRPEDESLRLEKEYPQSNSPSRDLEGPKQGSGSDEIDNVLHQLQMFQSSVGTESFGNRIFGGALWDEKKANSSIAGSNLSINDLSMPPPRSALGPSDSISVSEWLLDQIPEVDSDEYGREESYHESQQQQQQDDSHFRRSKSQSKQSPHRASKPSKPRVPISFRPTEAEIRRRQDDLSAVSEELCKLSEFLNVCERNIKTLLNSSSRQNKNDALILAGEELAHREKVLRERELNLANEVEQEATKKFNAKEAGFRQEVESIIKRYDTSLITLAKENRRLQGNLREVVAVNRRMRDQLNKATAELNDRNAKVEMLSGQLKLHKERAERLKTNLNTSKSAKIVIESTIDSGKTHLHQDSLSAQLKMDILKRLLSEKPETEKFDGENA